MNISLALAEIEAQIQEYSLKQEDIPGYLTRQRADLMSALILQKGGDSEEMLAGIDMKLQLIINLMARHQPVEPQPSRFYYHSQVEYSSTWIVSTAFEYPVPQKVTIIGIRGAILENKIENALPLLSWDEEFSSQVQLQFQADNLPLPCIGFATFS